MIYNVHSSSCINGNSYNLYIYIFTDFKLSNISCIIGLFRFSRKHAKATLYISRAVINHGPGLSSINLSIPSTPESQYCSICVT